MERSVIQQMIASEDNKHRSLPGLSSIPGGINFFFFNILWGRSFKIFYVYPPTNNFFVNNNFFLIFQFLNFTPIFRITINFLYQFSNSHFFQSLLFSLTNFLGITIFFIHPDNFNVGYQKIMFSTLAPFLPHQSH